jgi:hypothetical protein
MEIWRYGDIETRRHGEWRNGEMNMETSNGKWKMEAQAIYQLERYISQILTMNNEYLTYKSYSIAS